MSTKAREESKDFRTYYSFPIHTRTGKLWGDGTIIYDGLDEGLIPIDPRTSVPGGGAYAWQLGTGARQSSKDIVFQIATFTQINGIAGNDDNIWLALRPATSHIISNSIISAYFR